MKETRGVLRYPHKLDFKSHSPGGHVLSDSDTNNSDVACEHLFPGSTRDVGGVLRTNMNGVLARRNLLVGYDGVVLRSNRKAYTGETIMVAFSSEGITRARQIPCRIVALFWDNFLDDLVVTVLRFRSAKESEIMVMEGTISVTRAYGNRLGPAQRWKSNQRHS